MEYSVRCVRQLDHIIYKENSIMRTGFIFLMWKLIYCIPVEKVHQMKIELFNSNAKLNNFQRRSILLLNT